MKIWAALKHLFRPVPKERAKTVEYPRIARLSIARIPCRLCAKPLRDGDVVIWQERANGWQSDMAHAECAVLLKRVNGTITRMSGEYVLTDLDGGLIEPVPSGVLLLTEAEWADWISAASETITPRAKA